MKTYTETVFFLHVECVHTDEIKKIYIKNICSLVTYFYFYFLYYLIIKNINAQYSIFASLFY